MGRVYDAANGDRGVVTLWPTSMAGYAVRDVTRVEFDGDADHGPATVTAFVRAESGAGMTFVCDPATREPVRVAYRAAVIWSPTPDPADVLANTTGPAPDAPTVVGG